MTARKAYASPSSGSRASACFDIGARLVQAPDLQQERRPGARRTGHHAEARESCPVARTNPPPESAGSRAPTAPHLAAGRRRVAPERGLRSRPPTRWRAGPGCPTGWSAATRPSKTVTQRAIGLDADEKLCALDRGVDKRRPDVERPRLAREEEDRAPDELDQRPALLRRLAHDPFGVLIDHQPGVVDEDDRRAAAVAGPNGVAAADVEVGAGR